MKQEEKIDSFILPSYLQIKESPQFLEVKDDKRWEQKKKTYNMLKRGKNKNHFSKSKNKMVNYRLVVISKTLHLA